MVSGVVAASEFRFEPQTGLSDGHEVAIMAGEDHGLVHCESAISRLAPGASIAGHRHYFEESAFVLRGEVFVDIGGSRHHLRQNDYAFVPATVPHAWSNPGDQPAEWYRVRSPQPRLIGAGRGSFPSDDVGAPTDGSPVGTPHPTTPLVGHFADHHLPAPGPVFMRGYRGPNITNVSLSMLVDDYNGAIHHTMFMVEFLPGTDMHPSGDHFHPFEETYYFLRGTAIAHLDGRRFEVGPGDLVYSGTNAVHGYTMTSNEPVRWIEIQSPAPTPSGAVIFPADWIPLEE